VAAVVALTVVPIRASREVRPAILEYLAALDTALASHLPGHEHGVATAEARLDSAHAALASTVTSAAVETNVFSLPENVRNAEADRVDAVHDAYQRLTPLLSDASRRLHGWSDEQVAKGMHRLRDVVERAESSARGEVTRTPDAAEEVMPVPNAGSLGLSDSLRRAENLYARLTDLAAVLAEAPVRPAVSRRAAGRGRRPSVPESLP
jgi:hypothetical protein